MDAFRNALDSNIRIDAIWLGQEKKSHHDRLRPSIARSRLLNSFNNISFSFQKI